MELMKRSDGPAIRDTLIWIAAFDGVGQDALVVGVAVPRAGSDVAHTDDRPM